MPFKVQSQEEGPGIVAPTPLRRRQRAASPPASASVASSGRSGTPPSRPGNPRAPKPVHESGKKPGEKEQAAGCGHRSPPAKKSLFCTVFWRVVRITSFLLVLAGLAVRLCSQGHWALEELQHQLQHLAAPGLGELLGELGLEATPAAAGPPPEAAGKGPSQAERRAPETVEAPSLKETVAKALTSPGVRAAVLDVLAGSAAEFGRSMQRLPQLAGSAAAAGRGSDTDKLHAMVLELMNAEGAELTELRARLAQALETPQEAAAACAAAAAALARGKPEDLPSGLSKPLKMEVVQGLTSPGARQTGWVHQVLLNIGAATRVPSLVHRADRFRSKPADVVVGAGSAIPGDCFAFRGNGSVALRLLDAPKAVRYVVLEQPPRLALQTRLGSAPRRFSVFGDASDKAASGAGASAEPYDVPLGSFEYRLAAPAAQAFELAQSTPVRGLLLRFEGEGWGQQHRCIYRIRAFDAPMPLCSAARLAAAAAP